MRFIATADLHASNHPLFSFVTKKGLNSRLEDVLKVLNQMRVYAEKNGIKNFLFLGDLFHSRTRLSVDVLHLVWDMFLSFKLAGIDVYLLSGNHDLFQRSSTFYSVESFTTVCEVIREPRMFEIDSEKIYALPFIDDLSERRKALKELIKDKSKGGLLISHTPVIGAKANDNPISVIQAMGLKELYPELFSLILLGDFHQHQWLADNVMYVGSPLQIDRGEMNQEKGFWDITLEGKKFKTKLIPANAPKFVTLDEESEEEVDVKGNYVKVVIPTGMGASDVADIRKALEEQGARAVKVEQAPKVEEVKNRMGLKLDMTFQQMATKYVKGSESGLDEKRLIKIGEELMEESDV